MSDLRTMFDDEPSEADKRTHSTLVLLGFLNTIPLGGNLNPETEQDQRKTVYRAACAAKVVMALSRDWDNGLTGHQRIYAAQHIQLAFAPESSQHKRAHELEIWFRAGMAENAAPPAADESKLEGAGVLDFIPREPYAAPQKAIKFA